MKTSRIFLLAIVCALMGCATPQGPEPKTNQYWVTAVSSPFYKYGPAQGTGPDLTLAKEQRVTMLKRSFGFSQVATEKGQTGYVPSEDIAPAPPLPPPPKPPKQVRTKQRNADYMDVYPPQPPLGLPDPAVPIPSFRY